MAIIGHIAGVSVGAVFRTRWALVEAGLHRAPQAGIVGTARSGAESIVLSGGYLDDEDFGEVVYYTGHGGRDPRTGRQISDQELTRQNLALVVSHMRFQPVRVVRGAKAVESPFSPDSGYRYDGLYFVKEYGMALGRDGFRVVRFVLVRDLEGQPPLPVNVDGTESPKTMRQMANVERIVRNTQKAFLIKDIYDYTCQVSGTRLMLPTGPYAEAGHIRPLGRPHEGPDITRNLLCLAPDIHVLFDRGAFVLSDDLRVCEIEDNGLDGKRVRVERGHEIGAEFVRYHRRVFGP